MKSKAWLEEPGGVQVPDFEFVAGRRLRAELPLRRPDPDRAGEQGGHAPPRRAQPGRMGRGRADVRAPGGAEQFQPANRLSAERAGVMVNVADNSRIGIVLHFRAW